MYLSINFWQAYLLVLLLLSMSSCSTFTFQCFSFLALLLQVRLATHPYFLGKRGSHNNFFQCQQGGKTAPNP